MFFKRTRKMLFRLIMPNICQFFICVYLVKIIYNCNVTSTKKNDSIAIPTKNKSENIITKQPSYTVQDDYSINVRKSDSLEQEISSEKSDIDKDLIDSYFDVNLKDVL